MCWVILFHRPYSKILKAWVNHGALISPPLLIDGALSVCKLASEPEQVRDVGDSMKKQI